MKIAVLGAGAAGLTAAICLKEKAPENTVLLFDGNDRGGKKLLSTGSGHCNLTNLALDPARFHGSCTELAEQCFRRFGVKETLAFFEKLGIYCCDRDFYVYPRSREASSVREALCRRAAAAGTELHFSEKVITLRPEGKGFRILTDRAKYAADRVILCSGGIAAPKTGSDGSLLSELIRLGIRTEKPLPALVPLTAEERFCKNLAGVRTEGEVRLYISGTAAGSDRGEIQFTETGISGIPVFQLSGRAVRALENGKKVIAAVDLLPEHTVTETAALLGDIGGSCPDAESGDWLSGLLPSKLSPVLLKNAGIPLHVSLRELPLSAADALAKTVSELRFHICGCKGAEFAQVSSGGIAAEELTEGLELKKLPGVFAAGELIDIDGPCGGYNLQWAWTSGAIAAFSALGIV